MMTAALKILLPQSLGDADLCARFAYEAGTLAALADALDYINGASGQDGAQYTVAAVISQHVAVTLTRPTDGQAANGDVSVQADVQPTIPVQSVRFLVNGAEIGTAQAPPFAATWHPGSAASGAYAVRVEATGIDGQTATAQATVQYTTPHVTVQLLSPRDGAHLNASTQIRAGISPAASAQNVHIDFDGTTLATLQGPPWTATLDPSKTIGGQRTITVSATGLDGQTVTAQAKVFLSAPDSNTPIIVSLVLLALALALAAVALAIVVGSKRLNARKAPVLANPNPPLPGNIAYAGPAQQPASGISPGWLEEQRPDGTSLRWPLQPGETLIGRDVSNPNILLNDADVSRLQAAVRVQNGEVVFSDRGATNPSSLNGAPLAGERVLRDGDVLLLGSTRLVFLASQPAAAPWR